MPAIAERPKRVRPSRRPKASGMASRHIRPLRVQKLALSRTAFARLLKVSENTVFRWENQKVRPDAHSNQTLEHLDRLCDILRPSMEPPAIAQWLERPNTGLDNFRPVDLIEFEYGRQRLRALIEETGLVADTL